MPRVNLFNKLLPLILITTLLGVLAWAPSLLRRAHWEVDFGETAIRVPTQFPMERVFPVIGEGKKTTSLAEISGPSRRRLLVNLWATWCLPCLEEMPSLEYLNRELRADRSGKLPILVTISVDGASEEVGKLFSSLSYRPTFLTLHDPEGPFARSVGSTKFPETFLIDADGKILYKWLGPQDWLSAEAFSRLGG